MSKKGPRLRLLSMLGFLIVGAFTGFSLASEYINLLDTFVGIDASETPKLFNVIPINPIRLSGGEKTGIFIVFVMVGGMLGVIIENVTFVLARRTRTRLESMSPQDKFAGIIALVLGLVLTLLVRGTFTTPWWVNVITCAMMCYLSLWAVDIFKENALFYMSPSRPAKGSNKPIYRPKLLDTNVIIDGRIADVCRAGFVEGPIFVPKFIIEELQQIADSSDSLKRARGRRGLEILTQMQKEMDLQVPEAASIDPSEEVDARLVILAREVGGAIITNDFNLNKVAGLQGVDVLNVNELANALKPVVLPGEEMKVLIIKEGKEKEQGIGYLDDGTMIVVEGARRLIGETLQVNVTSVLQTVQGKMIFAKIRENGGSEEESVEDSIRSYTGGRPRRKTR